MKNFTFKTKKYKSGFFYRKSYDIKYNKKIIGQIGEEFPHTIRFAIVKKDIMEDGNPNCNWKWIELTTKKAKEFKSVDDAKEYLRLNVEFLINKYEFHSLYE